MTTHDPAACHDCADATIAELRAALATRDTELAEALSDYQYLGARMAEQLDAADSRARALEEWMREAVEALKHAVDELSHAPCRDNRDHTRCETCAASLAAQDALDSSAALLSGQPAPDMLTTEERAAVEMWRRLGTNSAPLLAIIDRLAPKGPDHE